MNYIKKRYLIGIVACIIICIISSLCFFKKDDDNVINISSLSKKFVDEYLNEVKNIENEDRENILIVVSKKRIEKKDTFGATKIIEAPNHQYILQYKNIDNKMSALNELRRVKTIRSVSENNVYELSETESNKTYNSWGVKSMGLDYATNISNQRNKEKITVAIIDTGCDIQLFNSSFNGKIEETYNLYDNDSSGKSTLMYDNFGHGTHIAGTIAESTPDNVKIFPVKVSNSNSMDTLKIIAAINYITYYEKADVINMSFGSYQENPALYDAIEAAKEKNIISVAAAGNDSRSTSSYPALYDNTISIGAVDVNLEKAFFTNYGEGLSFVAAGVDILSINGIKSGTSMATPHAVSTIAILKSFNKDITLTDTINILKNYATDLGIDGYDSDFGYGYINLSSIESCDNPLTQTCDNLGMFRIFVPNKLDIIEPVVTKYNYGSLTNILATKVELISTDGRKQSKTLSELEDAQISQYDPYSKELQTITVTYKDMTASFDVTNPENFESGWEYRKYYKYTNGNDYEAIEITKYKDHGENITKLYFPSIIDNNIINSISDSYLPDCSSIYNGSQDVLNYKEVYLPENLINIGFNAFVDFKKLKSVKSLSNESLILGINAFSNLKNLKEVIGNISFSQNSSNAFFEDTALQTVTLSDDVTIIPYYTFYDCEYLKNINLPNGLKTIDVGAFFGTGIENLHLPDSINVIEAWAFQSSKLKTINLPNSLTKIGITAFSGTKIEEIIIPSSVNFIGEGAFSISSLKSINVDLNNTIYDSRNNCNAVIETASNKLIATSTNTQIPNTVKTIGTYSFQYNNIKELNIPEGVINIEKDSFGFNCYLEKVNLPNSVKYIFSDLFSVKTFSGMDSRYRSTILYVNRDSYSHQYAINEKLSYKVNGEGNDDQYDGLIVSFFRYKFNAFERVDKENLEVKAFYENKSEAEIITDYEIEYYSATDSLRYNDPYYTIRYNLSNGIKNLQFPITVQVDKATPNYILPVNLVGNINQDLQSVELPNGFEWMDKNQVLTEAGNKTFKARYIPQDTINYNTVENIDINVFVSDKILISPNIELNTKIFDGTKNVSSQSLIIQNLNSSDYILESIIAETENVGDTKATVKLKLTNNKFITHSFDGGLQEKEFEVDLKIIPQKLEKPVLKNIDYIYNGQIQDVQIDNFDDTKMNIVGNKRRDAGKQDVEITLKNNNYIWSDDTNEKVILKFEIAKCDSIFYYGAADEDVIYDGYNHTIFLYYDPGITITYMDLDGNYALTEIPTFSIPGTYKIKFKLHMNNNYNDIYDEATLIIRKKKIDIETNDYEGIYDGREHYININDDRKIYDIKYSIDNEDYNLNDSPKFKEVGEYTVNYKMTDDIFEDIIGSKKVKIYGIKDFDSELTLKENIIITKNNNFVNLKNKIETYSIATTYTHFDENKLTVNEDKIKTGDIIRVGINDIKNYEYKISVLGDINKDGKITSADYIRIKKHIMQLDEIVDNLYFYSADINKDGKITSADYVKIRKHIMNGEDL